MSCGGEAVHAPIELEDWLALVSGHYWAFVLVSGELLYWSGDSELLGSGECGLHSGMALRVQVRS